MSLSRPSEDGLDVIAIRTPTFSVQLLDRYLAAEDPSAALREIFSEPLARDALALASYDVLAALERGDRSPSLDRALVRYLMRMTMRPTPFGLFATACVAAPADGTRLVLGDVDEIQVVPRLSVDVVTDAVDAARAELGHRHRRFRVNRTARRSGDRVHYVETRSSGSSRTHHLVAARDDGALGLVLEAARDWVSLDGLADVVASELDVPLEDALGFVGEVASAQLLVDDLQIAVAGPPPDQQVIGTQTPVSSRIEAAHRVLTAPLTWRERLDEVAAVLGLPASSTLVAVDAIRPPDRLTLGPAVIDELRRGVELAAALTTKQLTPALERFRDAFVTRWSERWIPLLEALDPETGIPFEDSTEATPLLGAYEVQLSSRASLPFTQRDAAMLRLLGNALSDGLMEVEIDETALAQLLSLDPVPLPEAYAISCRIAARSAEAMDRGELEVHVRNVNGPGGSRLLARFAHADDALATRLRAHHRHEAARHPGDLLAEVVHLPEGRVGNILSRPALRPDEIVLLSGSTLDEAHQIAPGDLLLGAVNGELQLRLADGRRVRPRMASAHAYFRGNVGLYRFLCMMQHADGSQALSFMWGAASGAPFLPRVRLGRTILALATWNLGPEDLAVLDLEDALDSVAAVRARRRLPRLVAVVTGEMELTLDLEDRICCEVFIEMMRDGHTEVMEQWPPIDLLPLKGPGGAHVSDLIVAYSARGGVAPEPSRPMLVGESPKHLPGGEWLYLKVYCGTSAADAILEALAPTLAGREWFFIRYADPDHHLRIRVRHGLDLLPTVHDVLVARSDVVTAQVDTYEPEVERYGGVEAITIAEQIFAVDSHFAVEVLARLSDGDVGADERWRITLASLDALWHDSGLSREEQDAAILATQASYAQEFGLVGDRTKPIGARMRADRDRLQRIMARDPQDDLAPGYVLIEQRSKHLRPLFQQLKELEAEGRLCTSLASIVQSVAHMNVNRWLRIRQRPQEAVLYELLVRLRRSQAARS